MKRILPFVLSLSLLVSSCIPTKIAPKFKNKDYRVMKAKKFQRTLPRETSFVFKDPKDADEFYHYINTKLKLNHKNVGFNSPVQIKGKIYYLSYKEVGKDDKNLNLGFLATDLVLSQKAGFTVFDNNYTRRTGHWYILITVYDENVKNCLLDKHPMKSKIIQYLKDLKQEYLTTHNYEELLLTKKS